MTLRAAVLAGLAATALAGAPATAQDRGVFPGDRVRVTQAGRWTGFVQAVDSDSMHVVPDGERAARAIALASLERLEVSVGEKGRGRPFLIGGLAGAGIAAGTAAIISARHSCDQTPDEFGFTGFCETVGPVAVVASTVIGFAVGGAVGALFGGGEKWVRAELPTQVAGVRLRLRVEPHGATRASR